jgi:hypothetical protein
MIVRKDGKKSGQACTQEKEKKASYILWALPALPVEGPEPNLEQGRQSALLLSEFGKGWQFVIFLVLTAGEVNI